MEHEKQDKETLDGKVNPLFQEFVENFERVQEMRKSSEGKYQVIGVDKFDYEDFLVGEYDTAEEALRVARKKTAECMKLASAHSIATVFYAYAPDGTYLGGDAWVGE